MLPLTLLAEVDYYSDNREVPLETVFEYAAIGIVEGYDYGDLLTLPPDQIEKLDIGVLNIICAQGLPGGENIDLFQCLIMLDEWAAHTKVETERNFYKYEQNPEEYENSEAYFRMLVLTGVLQQDFGIKYASDKAVTPLPASELVKTRDFYKDSSDIFIHGLLSDEHRGTCASLPVLLVAVGRRLGYPLYLVSAKAHAFTRWDDPEAGERLNIEYHGNGMSTFPDEYYHEWPYPMTEAEIESGFFLKNMTSQEDLAVFMLHRGLVLEQSERYHEAQIAYARGGELMPDSMHYQSYLIEATKRINPAVLAQGNPYQSTYFDKLQRQKRELVAMNQVETNQNYYLRKELTKKEGETEALRKYIDELQSMMGMSGYEKRDAMRSKPYLMQYQSTPSFNQSLSQNELEIERQRKLMMLKDYQN